MVLTVRHNLSTGVDSCLDMPLTPTLEGLHNAHTYQVTIFGSSAAGFDMGDAAAQFFSNHLEQPARLLYIGGSESRPIPARALVPRKTRLLSSISGEEMHPQQIAFADGAPILITNTASKHDAVARLPKDAKNEDQILRFRSNIHISVPFEVRPYAEDTWRKLCIHNHAGQSTELDLVFSTVRCMSLNMGFQRGGIMPPDRQLYKLLTPDRRINLVLPQKPCFGRYAFAGPIGHAIRLGDRVEVTSSL